MKSTNNKIEDAKRGLNEAPFRRGWGGGGGNNRRRTKKNGFHVKCAKYPSPPKRRNYRGKKEDW
jgi:hypothetical protein